MIQHLVSPGHNGLMPCNSGHRCAPEFIPAGTVALVSMTPEQLYLQGWTQDDICDLNYHSDMVIDDYLNEFMQDSLYCSWIIFMSIMFSNWSVAFLWIMNRTLNSILALMQKEMQRAYILINTFSVSSSSSSYLGQRSPSKNYIPITSWTTMKLVWGWLDFWEIWK